MIAYYKGSQKNISDGSCDKSPGILNFPILLMAYAENPSEMHLEAAFYQLSELGPHSVLQNTKLDNIVLLTSIFITCPECESFQDSWYSFPSEGYIPHL